MTAALEKAVKWDEIARRNDFQMFEKVFAKFGAQEEWKFDWSGIDTTLWIRGYRYSIEQAKMVLALLGELPDAEKELAAKTAKAKIEQELFK